MPGAAERWSGRASIPQRRAGRARQGGARACRSGAAGRRHHPHRLRRPRPRDAAGRVAGVVTEKGRIACDRCCSPAAPGRGCSAAVSASTCRSSGASSVDAHRAASTPGPRSAGRGPASRYPPPARRRLLPWRTGGISVDIVPDSFRLLFAVPAGHQSRRSAIAGSAALHRRMAPGAPLVARRAVAVRGGAGARSRNRCRRRPTRPRAISRRCSRPSGMPDRRSAGPAYRCARRTPCRSSRRSRALPGFFLATGFSGHGFGIGPAAGKLAADLVTGANPVVDPAPSAIRASSTAAGRPDERAIAHSKLDKLANDTKCEVAKTPSSSELSPYGARARFRRE